MTSSIKDLRDNLVSRESGKRLYVSPKEYADQIRRPTIKGFDSGDQPFSEFEKPYWEDSYEEMEYFMWNFPEFSPLRWDFSWDNPSIPTTEQATLGGTGFFVCDCFALGGFCPGETRCIAMDCTYPIVGVQFSRDWYERDFAIFLENDQTLCVTANEDAGGAFEINISMRLPSGSICSEDDYLISSAVDCEDCDTADPMEADPANPSLVNDSTNYYIAVINGVGPFSWSIEAPDSPNVDLQWAAGSRRYNYLQVVDGCGSITVTVIDSCGTVVLLPFRSTDGYWQSCAGSQRGGTACGCPGFDTFGPWLMGTGPGDPDLIVFSYDGHTMKIEDTLNNCVNAGLGGLPSCCDNRSPDCHPFPGGTPNCWSAGSYPDGGNCGLFGYPGINHPCLNDCEDKGATPKCSAALRSGQSGAFFFWNCS